jgi:hypothetical protein
MPRGFFTTCTTVLFDTLPSLDAIEAALGDFTIRARRAADEESWFGGFDELVVDYRPAIRGFVTVERIDRTWPDTMGDPKHDEDTFGAWSMGAFGPGAFPGNLARAAQQAVSWTDDPNDAVARHRGLIRLRGSYVMGAGEDAVVLPEDADVVDELTFVARLAEKLVALPGAIAYFNPSAELLLQPEELSRRLADANERDVPPLDTFVHVRLMNVAEADGWSLMDTVGADQVFLPDHEAVLDRDQDPNEIAAFLMNLAYYLLQRGEVIEDGDTIDGPGGVWRAKLCEEPLVSPPRRTLRWALNGTRVPAVFEV